VITEHHGHVVMMMAWPRHHQPGRMSIRMIIMTQKFEIIKTCCLGMSLNQSDRGVVSDLSCVNAINMADGTDTDFRLSLCSLVLKETSA
jgi:hypothetical protein